MTLSCSALHPPSPSRYGLSEDFFRYIYAHNLAFLTILQTPAFQLSSPPLLLAKRLARLRRPLPFLPLGFFSWSWSWPSGLAFQFQVFWKRSLLQPKGVHFLPQLFLLPMLEVESGDYFYLRPLPPSADPFPPRKFQPADEYCVF